MTRAMSSSLDATPPAASSATAAEPSSSAAQAMARSAVRTQDSSATANYPQQALSALETYKKKDASKVVVRFKAIGNAPIMKNNHFRITAFNRFQAVIQFLRKELGWQPGDALVSEERIGS